MSLDRRSFFKLFGAGATILPVAASGAPLLEAPARIVTPPQVELAPPLAMLDEPAIVDIMSQGEIVKSTLTLTTSTGKTVVVTGRSALVRMRSTVPAFFRAAQNGVHELDGPLEVSWEIEGVMTGKPHFGLKA